MATTTPSFFSRDGGEDPLSQLDTYCKSKHKQCDEETTTTKNVIGSSSSNISSSNNNSEIPNSATVIVPAIVNDSNNDINIKNGVDIDELLSVAEFIFGHKTLSSALAIVDSRHSLITKLVAPSGRFVHVIRSSSSSGVATAGILLQHANGNNANANNANTNTAQAMLAMLHETNNSNHNEDDEYYLCLLSPSQSSRSRPPLRYCSCRSFLEKSNKKALALASISSQGGTTRTGCHSYNFSNDESLRDGPPVCKHLLALFLLPRLVAASTATTTTTVNKHTQTQTNNSNNTSYYCCQEIKSVTEEDFASLILHRIL